MEMLASMQNLTAAVATSNYGKKIMQTMGWSEQVVFVFVPLCSGQGLGREGTGIKESIIVKKKSNEEGVVVVGITSGSGADKAGLRVGDVITAVNGKSVSNAAYLRYQLYQYEVGETIQLTYNRDGKVRTTDITLTKVED